MLKMARTERMLRFDHDVALQLAHPVADPEQHPVVQDLLSQRVQAPEDKKYPSLQAVQVAAAVVQVLQLVAVQAVQALLIREYPGRQVEQVTDVPVVYVQAPHPADADVTVVSVPVAQFKQLAGV